MLKSISIATFAFLLSGFAPQALAIHSTVIGVQSNEDDHSYVITAKPCGYYPTIDFEVTPINNGKDILVTFERAKDCTRTKTDNAYFLLFARDIFNRAGLTQQEDSKIFFNW